MLANEHIEEQLRKMRGLIGGVNSHWYETFGTFLEFYSSLCKKLIRPSNII